MSTESIEEITENTHRGEGCFVTELPADGEIPCPAKDCTGHVVEQDIATRWNRLRVEDGKIYAACGDGDWAADDPRWVCSDTGWQVFMPPGTEVEDYC